MRSRPSSSADRAGTGRARLLILLGAALLSVLAGVTGFGAAFETSLRGVRDLTRSHDASGDIVIAGIDDRSMARIGAWPWPRSTYAQLSDRLRAAGARRLFFDIDFSSPSVPRNDALFAAALARWRQRPVLATRFVIDSLTGERHESEPIPSLRASSDLATINVYYSASTITDVPFSLRSGGRLRPSFATALSRFPIAGHPEGATFPIDFSLRIKTIPVFSIVDLLDGKVAARKLAGRQVVVAAVSSQLNDLYFAPGKDLIPGVFFHVMGAETLRRGLPADLGWAIPLAVMLLAMAWPLRRGGFLSIMAAATALPTALVLPFLLDRLLIFVHVVPSLVAVATIGGGAGWLYLRHALRTRSTVNQLSGLPNLEALRRESTGAALLIIARVQNHAELSAALTPVQQKALIEQITARLRLGLPTRLYQGDEGIFAWLAGEEHVAGIGEHLDALHSLFRSPAAIEGNLYDVGITFGVDGARERSLANRLGSALVAADEAAAEGARWKVYEIERFKESAWKLSMLSQLDAAIDDGGLWVAYQPKLDLVTGRIVGAEALARWTHPEKGPISPDEFIKAAEQSNRVERLTAHVLDRAVAAAAAVNARGFRFGIAVNLSARLLASDGVIDMVQQALARHALAPELLTLEVTETAMLVDDPLVAGRLARLRERGIQLSVDDYGTGLSTLEYLRMIPATEIKIDRSFVQALTANEGDRVIVRSTIELAHSLGRKVVAEGVEERETLDALRDMGCDLAQGYLISRPVTFRALSEQLFTKGDQKAA